MEASKKAARLAGFIYLVVVLTGMFSLAYVPSKLINWKDANQTFQNIASSTQLFRLSIASSMLCYIAFLLLPLVLYKILRRVDETSSKLMVAFAVVSVPISFINLQNKISILALIDEDYFSKTLTSVELQTQTLLYLEQYDSGLLIAQIFWGLWLLPFGYLVYTSNLLPKLFGILLLAGGIGYLVKVFGITIIPDFNHYAISRYVTLPAALGEIGICLWLLIVGIKKTKNEIKPVPGRI